jgi:hypothetical protein
MNHSSVKPQTVMVNNITSHNNMNHYFVKHETVMVGYIVLLYCLRFDRGAVIIVVAVILLSITV